MCKIKSIFIIDKIKIGRFVVDLQKNNIDHQLAIN